MGRGQSGVLGVIPFGATEEVLQQEKVTWTSLHNR